MESPFKIGQKLTTDEVFEVIRIADDVPHWESVWKAKKHESWESWRKTHFKPILNKELDWTFVEIASPLIEVPQWRGCMTPTWNTWAYGNFLEKPPRLKDLITNPFVQNHWYIKEMAQNFKGNLTMMTLLKTPNNDIYVLEGMHRACALSIIAQNNDKLNCRLLAAMANWPESEPPKLGNWENK